MDKRCLPLKRGRKIKSLATFDIETKKDWATFNFCGTYDGFDYRRFETPEEFLDFLLDKRHSRNHTVFFAHYNNFDSMFLMEILHEEGYKIKPIVSQGWLGLDIYEGRNKWSIRDSYALLPYSLDALMKTFKTKHQKVSLKDLDARNISDCIALYDILNKHFQNNLHGNYGITYSQAAMTSFRKDFLKHTIEDNTKFDPYIRQAYFGGRTEIFQFNTDPDKRFYLYDVNSLYPAMMFNHNYPIGEFKRFPSDHNLYEIEGVAHVTVNDNLHFPLFPEFREKLLFMNKRKSGWYMLPFVRYAKSLGMDITINKIYATSNYAPIFDKYIEHYYKIKKESKGKDPVSYLNAKLMMNSLYGKFGQKLKQQVIEFNPDKRPDTYIPLTPDESIIKYERDAFSSFIKPSIAAYVTSYAITTMHKYKNRLDPEIIFNMDTDSLYLSEKKLENSKKLGKMELENSVKGLMIFLPKAYISDKKIKCKGVSIYDKDEDDKLVLNKQRVIDYFAGREVSYSRGIDKIKTAIRTGKWVKARTIKKSMKSCYDKRLMVGNMTFPLKSYGKNRNRESWEAMRAECNKILPSFLDENF